MSSSAGGGRITFSLIREEENSTNIVDTELRLSTVNSRVSNSIPLPLFIQENYFPQPDHVQASSHSETVIDDDDGINGADKTLSLLPRNSAVCIPSVMRIPTPPLRWSRPYFFGASGDETLSLGLPGSRRLTVTKRKRREDENQRPLIPKERIPGLFQTLKSRGGSGPVFLIRKKLEDSDVQKGNQSMLVARGERVMEFLREEEAVNDGIKILGIDGGGEVYENMGLTKWPMLKLIVIKWDWRRVVARNNAQAGDVVEIWGYRENQKPCLAFNFMKEEEIELSSAASTSNSL